MPTCTLKITKSIAISKKEKRGHPNTGVGNYFTRRARFGKTVEAAGRTLIGKQGEDLFFLEFWRSRSTYECDLQNKRFSPRFLFQFCTAETYFFKIIAIHDL